MMTTIHDQMCDDISYNNNHTCPICMSSDQEESYNILPCSHIIHVGCYNDMLNAGHENCPICRSSLEYKNIIPIKNDYHYIIMVAIVILLIISLIPRDTIIGIVKRVFNILNIK